MHSCLNRDLLKHNIRASGSAAEKFDYLSHKLFTACFPLNLADGSQVQGMRVYTGGEELRRAAAALSGPSLAPRPSFTTAFPSQQVSNSAQNADKHMPPTTVLVLDYD